MKLGIGLIAHSPQWEQLLTQEGAPFTHVGIAGVKPDCSVLIVNRVLDSSELRGVESYLREGGAVLGYSAYLQNVCGTVARQERLDYLFADHDPIFPGIHLVDLAIPGLIPREANCLKTNHNTFGVFAGALGGGVAVLLPFDPAAAIGDSRSANKSFYATRERLPTEHVSVVAKGELSHLLHAALEYLHTARGLPYVHLWYYPDGKQNLFAFRIDSDKGSRQEIDELYKCALDYDIRMSWFLDVKSHEEWLQHFAFLSGQEIGVHCYEHRTYDSFDENLKNILHAKRRLEQVGVSSSGFTAPYGSWNPSLAKAIDQVGFEYSSEFSFAYDAFPFFHSDRERMCGALQVPIHPICIGSLRRVGYSDEQMKEYFAAVIDRKLLQNEPLFFYHHPTHHCWDVVRFIFKYVREREITNTTMLEYARWWKTRTSRNLRVSYVDDMLTIEHPHGVNDSVWIRITHPKKKQARIPFAATLNFKTLEWGSVAEAPIPPSDLRRIREFDPREMLGGIITTLNRKFLEGRTNS